MVQIVRKLTPTPPPLPQQLVTGGQLAGGSWQVAQLFGGCKLGWHFVSSPAGNGGKGNPDIAGAVLSTFYVLIIDLL